MVNPHDHSDPTSGTELHPEDLYFGGGRRYHLTTIDGRLVLIDTATDKTIRFPVGSEGELSTKEPDEERIDNIVEDRIESEKEDIYAHVNDVVRNTEVNTDSIEHDSANGGDVIMFTHQNGPSWQPVEIPDNEDTITEDFRCSNVSLAPGGVYTMARMTPPAGCMFNVKRAGARDGEGVTPPGLRVEIYDNDNGEQLFHLENSYQMLNDVVPVGNRDVSFRVINDSSETVDGISGNITGGMSQ